MPQTSHASDEARVAPPAIAARQGATRSTASSSASSSGGTDATSAEKNTAAADRVVDLMEDVGHGVSSVFESAVRRCR